MTLRASWKRTTNHLRSARQELPNNIMEFDGEGSLAAYEEYLEYNELDLAIDELELLAMRTETPKAFWLSLLAAAREMSLTEHQERYALRIETHWPA